MRNAEARITLGVIAERSADHDEAISQGFRAIQAGRKSLPSLKIVAAELTREFARTGHGEDQDVRDFQAALSANVAADGTRAS